ncbi:MAG: glycerate kinase [Bacteroidetes bacterium]|nr:glycerate kinase [Bacteroidota bacterium]
MKILIATDSFKDCLSARQVGEALKSGILQSKSDLDVSVLPMADGGEGTVQALVDATGGRIIQCQVNDPLMRPTNSFYGILGDGQTAAIEMAATSGIEKLTPEERNPWITSTYGTGELIVHALENGCRHIIMGIGGSATNDCGAGMAHALGYKFPDHNQQEIIPTGGNLSEIRDIKTETVHHQLKDCEISVACDVTNPLTGVNGASYVYGPQKGANSEMVEKLDANLTAFANLIQKQLHIHITKVPGSGAAGGLGGGLLAFTPAGLQKGFDLIAEKVNLEEHVKNADIVITGEGKIDYQTQFGKTPFGVATMAKKYNKPVIGVAGTLGEGYNELINNGFDAIFSIIDAPMTLEKALINAEQLLENAGKNIFKSILLLF